MQDCTQDNQNLELTWLPEELTDSAMIIIKFQTQILSTSKNQKSLCIVLQPPAFKSRDGMLQVSNHLVQKLVLAQCNIIVSYISLSNM